MKKVFPASSSGTDILSQLNSRCKSDNHSHSQLDISDRSSGHNNQGKTAQKRQSRQSKKKSPQQLELFAAPNTGLSLKIKPQIASIPGVPPKERHRYRVLLGREILGDQLTLDEAIALAKRGAS
jgi:hypothetical protein